MRNEMSITIATNWGMTLALNSKIDLGVT
jgi:hypothetical protein